MVTPASPPQLRGQAAPVAVHGAGERLAHEAEAYLAAVAFFRAEGFEPMWRSKGAENSSLSLHALDGAGTVSVAGEAIKD